MHCAVDAPARCDPRWSSFLLIIPDVASRGAPLLTRAHFCARNWGIIPSTRRNYLWRNTSDEGEDGMTGAQFIKRVRQWAKDKALERPEFIAKKGRGSHGTLFSWG